MNKYTFIIDTDSYSGNFERELCAYITGQVGECGVGEEYSKIFQEQFPAEYKIFKNLVYHKLKEDECRRPCDIEPTPGRFNHGMGTNFDEDADLEVVRKDFIRRTEDYYKPLLEKAEQSVLKGLTEWEPEVKRYQTILQNVTKEEMRKYPAYESVSIFFSTEPSQEIIDFMKKRAESFSANETIGPRKEKIIIKGYRHR